MTEELDAVFFDLGGTLIDVAVPRERTWTNVLARHGMEVEEAAVARALRSADRDLDDRFAKVQDSDEMRFWVEYDERVLEELGLEAPHDGWVDHLSQSFAKTVMDEEAWAEYPDAKPLLSSLSQRDMTVGLISNATDLARRVMRRLDLERYFDPIVISSEVGARKPSREIFDIALERADVSPSRSLFIGDKPGVDIVGAGSTGMNAILIDRQGTFPDTPFLRIADLRSLGQFL